MLISHTFYETVGYPGISSIIHVCCGLLAHVAFLFLELILVYKSYVFFAVITPFGICLIPTTVVMEYFFGVGVDPHNYLDLITSAFTAYDHELLVSSPAVSVEFL